MSTVEWLFDSTSASSYPPFGTDTVANTYASPTNFANCYASNTVTNGWVEIDLGSGNAEALTKIWLGPFATSAQESYLYGLQVQYSDDNSAWSLLQTINDYPIPYQLTPYTINGAGSHRYWRLNGPGGLVATAFRWEGSFTSSPRYLPQRPVISPWGGKYTTGTSITLTTGTVGASIYYTTDGSTPTTSSTLYTGPISLPSITSGSQWTLKAISYLASATSTTSEVVTAVFSPQEFVPDTGVNAYGNGTVPEIVTDDRGLPVQGTQGNWLYDPPSGKYYRYGKYESEAENSHQQRGVECYSSTDLLNWKWEGLVAPSIGTVGGNTVEYAERFHVLYNATFTTYQYVMWCHAEPNGSFNTGWAACATASSPTGPFTWQSVSNPNGSDVALDCSLFHDPGGGWYFVYDENHSLIKAALLDPSTDHTTFQGTYVALTSGGNREAPVLYYQGGNYYLFRSVLFGYFAGGPAAASSGLSYATASTLAGLASASEVTVWASTPADTQAAWNAQPCCVIRPQGHAGAILVCDYWSPNGSYPTLYQSRSALWPIPDSTLPSPTLSIATPYAWNLSALPSTGNTLTIAAASAAATATVSLTNTPPPATLVLAPAASTATVALTLTEVPPPNVLAIAAASQVATTAITLDEVPPPVTVAIAAASASATVALTLANGTPPNVLAIAAASQAATVAITATAGLPPNTLTLAAASQAAAVDLDLTEAPPAVTLALAAAAGPATLVLFISPGGIVTAVPDPFRSTGVRVGPQA